MARKDLTVDVDANVAKFQRGMKSAAASASIFEKEMRRQERETAKRHAAMSQLGGAMVAVGAATLLGAGYAVKAAIDWESAWAGVTKTVSGTPQQMAVLEQSLRDLAKELPSSHKEIAAVAEAAGQLGVKRQNIVSFTRTMINLGETTNLSAEEAATGLARFMNVMGTSQKDVGKLGASLVALGNAGASTESEILAMALRLAGAGKQIGLTEGEVLGFANALSSVGIEAEAGGSAFSRVMINIDQAALEGGDQLEGFARVAGMSANDFRTAYEKNAGGAIIKFVQGLGRMQKAGGNVFGVLKDLGLSEIRVRDALLRAAGASDMFTSSLRMGNTAFRDGRALLEEANKRYNTTAARLQIARNQLNDFAISMGETLLPAVGAAADKIGGLVQWFGNLPGPVKTALGVLGGVAGTLSLLGGAAMLVVPKIAEFRSALDNMGGRAAKLNRGLGSVGSFLGGPWGIALGLGVAALGVFASAKADAEAEVEEFTRALEADSGAIAENSYAWAAHKLEEEGALAITDQLGISFGEVTRAVLNQGNALPKLRNKLHDIIAAEREKNKQGGYAISQDEERAVVAQQLLEILFKKNGTVQDGVEKHKRETKAAAEAEAQSGKTADAARKHALQQGNLNYELEDGKTGVDEFKEALDKLNGTHINADEALIRYKESITRANEALDKNGATLNLNTEAGQDNYSKLLDMADGANNHIGALAEQEGGLEKARKAHQRYRDDLYKVALAMTNNETKAKELVDRYLANPDIYMEMHANATLNANIKPAEHWLQFWKKKADGTWGITQLDTRIDPATGKLQFWRKKADGTWGWSNLNSRVDPATGKLQAWVKMANGQWAWVNVNANTQPARNQAKRIVTEINGYKAKINVTATGKSSVLAGGFQKQLEARGDILRAMARGGLLGMANGGGLTPMPGHKATVVPPNTWRVVGDRMRDDEAFIPINRDPRSMAILAETAKRMGFQLQAMARGGVLGMAAGGAVRPGASRGGAGSQGGGAAPDELTRLQLAADAAATGVQNLDAKALSPLVPSLDEVAKAAGTDTVGALDLMGKRITPLTSQTIRSGKTMRNTWGHNTKSVMQAQARQSGQYNLLAGRLRGATGRMSRDVDVLRSRHNADWAHMRGASGTAINRITRQQFGTMHRGLGGLRTGFWNTSDAVRRSMHRIRGYTRDPIKYAIQQPVNRGLIAAWNRINGFFGLRRRMGMVPVRFAEGGFHEQHKAQIAPAGAMRLWAEPETGGEAYIPLARQKRQRSTQILDEVAGRFGYQLTPDRVAQFADGGLWKAMYGVVKKRFPSATLNSAYRPGDPGYHGSGRATDLGGPMGAINRFLASKWPNSTELIYTPGINLWHGRPHTYNAGTRADHYDHVHWAMTNAAMLANPQLRQYGGGGGGFDFMGYIRQQFAGTRNMIKQIRGRYGDNRMAIGAEGMAKQATTAAENAAVKAMAQFSAGGGAGVERWRGVGLRALAIAGQARSNIGRLLMQMNSESGGDPGIVNDWDSNWVAGHPSVGLMQVIGPTYRKYRHPQFDFGPYKYGTSVNPLSNILASIRYTVSEYGSLVRGWRGTGYRKGGVAAHDGPGYLHQGERVLDTQQTRAFDRLVSILDTKRGVPSMHRMPTASIPSQRQGPSGDRPIRITGGKLEIVRGRDGGFEAWMRDVAVQEMNDDRSYWGR